MLPPLGSGRDGRLRACASGVLLAAVLGAGMATGTAAGAEQDEPAPPPVQIGPPPVTAPPSAPTNPPPTAIVILVPPQSPTITLTVPAVPAAKQAVAKQASASAAAPAAKEETAAPRSAARTRERDRLRQTRSYVEPTAPKATAKPKRKPKPVRRPKQLPAAVSAPVVPRYAVVVRDSSRASAGLGVQLPPQAVAAAPPDNGLYLLIALAVAGSLLLGVAGAASRLAGYWPKIFIPVIRERDGLSFFGACLIVCGIVAWAIVAPVA